MFGTKTTHVLKRSLTLLSTGLALAVFATATSAGTFTVDATVGATADFTEIQEALDSPLVQDGDVLLVQPGEYVKVETSKSVTIRGMGIRPSEVVVLEGLPTFPSASYFEDATANLVLTNLTFQDGLVLARCSGVTLLKDVSTGTLRLSQMSLARIDTVTGSPSWAPLRCDVEQDSWVDVIHTDFISAHSFGFSVFGGIDGASGLSVSGGSYVRLADGNLAGGNGGVGSSLLFHSGGAGGPGLRVSEQSTVHLLGNPGNTITGGDGGWGWDVEADGNGGPGIRATEGSTVRSSSYTLIGGFDPSGWAQAAPYSGDPLNFFGTALQDPLLSATGDFTGGAQSIFTIQGNALAPVVLFGGAGATSTPLPGVLGMLAVNYQVLLNVGATDASGQYVHGFTMPAGIPAGLIATVQAGLFYAGDGSTRLSNPVTVLVP